MTDLFLILASFFCGLVSGFWLAHTLSELTKYRGRR